jgi:hypothetical protein
MPKARLFAAFAGAAIATMLSLSTACAQSISATGDIVVDLQSPDRSVRIDQLLVDGTSLPVCYVPCRKALPRDGKYVIRGEGVPATSQFVLPDDRSDLTLTVNPGSRAGRIAGVTLGIVGFVAMTVGYAISGGDRFPDKDGNRPPPPSPWGLVIGLGGMSLAGVGVGIWMSSETRVWSSTGHSFVEAPPPAPRKRPALAFTARGLEF